MKIFIAVVGILALASSSLAANKRCTLATDMYNLGVPKDQLAVWTCLAKYESSYKKDLVGPVNENGSKDYGIFQINSKYWCKPSDGSTSYNLCKVNCDDLLTDDITASVACARKVLERQGWKAWSTLSKCQGTLSTIDVCFS
ncbi:lysozyme 1-like [Calliphora vicina]|uniref:lysozyme 1-like n=1 Tax=Calliphora vicina TaxID=7373 RepID=UPI00325C1CF0